jgi:hypothetical protein
MSNGVGGSACEPEKVEMQKVYALFSHVQKPVV